MFERIPRSWELVKASAAVLKSDKELLIFPILSAIGMLVVTATFALPLFFTGSLDHGDLSLGGYVILFAFYLTQYFVIIYANSALVGAALIRFRGGDPTVRDGLRVASSHLGSIVGYAAISATVGLILRWFQERGSLGALASSVFGLAWSLATFLVVPVLVAENLGPLESIQRSTQLLRKTWGEQIVGNFSIGLIFGLFFLALMVMGIGGIIVVGSAGDTLLTLPLIIVFVLATLILVLLSSALSGIFSAAVYNYAATGNTGGFFREELIKGAFRTKGKSSI